VIEWSPGQCVETLASQYVAYLGPPSAALRRLLREANASFRAASAGRWRRPCAHASAVKGDVAVLEWIRDRVAHTLDAVDRTRIDTRLVRLRANVSDARFAAATRSAADLRRLLAGG
jgi:hypothetical protein